MVANQNWQVTASQPATGSIWSRLRGAFYMSGGNQNRFSTADVPGGTGDALPVTNQHRDQYAAIGAVSMPSADSFLRTFNNLFHPQPPVGYPFPSDTQSFNPGYNVPKPSLRLLDGISQQFQTVFQGPRPNSPQSINGPV